MNGRLMIVLASLVATLVFSRSVDAMQATYAFERAHLKDYLGGTGLELRYAGYDDIDRFTPFLDELHLLWYRGALDARARYPNSQGYEITSYYFPWQATPPLRLSAWYFFRPNDSMTREQFFAILGKAFNVVPSEEPSQYVDYRDPSYSSKNFAEWFVARGEAQEISKVTVRGYGNACARVIAAVNTQSRPVWYYAGFDEIRRQPNTLTMPSGTKAVEVWADCTEKDGVELIDVVLKNGQKIDVNLRTYSLTPIFFASVSDTYYPWVRGVMNAGWVDGYPDGTFRPQQYITRGEAVMPLVRAMGDDAAAAAMPPEEVDQILQEFSDAATIPQQLRPYVAFLVKSGVFLGKNGAARMNDVMTRAEGAGMIARALRAASEGGLIALAVPSRAAAGEKITLVALTAAGSSRVEVEVPMPTGGTTSLALEKRDAMVDPISGELREKWEGEWQTPGDLPSGKYDLIFTAEHGNVGTPLTARVGVEILPPMPSSPSSLEDVCMYTTNPVWAKPGESTVVGCTTNPDSAYRITGGSVSVPGVGSWQLTAGGGDVWYAEIQAPSQEGVYAVIYNLALEDSAGRQVNSEGRQMMIVSEDAGAGYCTPPEGVTTSPGVGSAKTRLIR